jgi:hypothetical protein
MADGRWPADRVTAHSLAITGFPVLTYCGDFRLAILDLRLGKHQSPNRQSEIGNLKSA